MKSMKKMLSEILTHDGGRLYSIKLSSGLQNFIFLICDNFLELNLYTTMSLI